MPEESKHCVRKKERYNHVYIRLQVKTGDEWITVRALDWNDIGLNFFIEREIEGNAVELKKGPKRFPGTIVWTRKSGDDTVILETILNTLLFEQLHKIDNKETMGRIIRLIRAQGRIEEKKKLLSVLDPSILAEGKVDSMLEKDKMDTSPYRYGILMDSGEWREIVRNALDMTSAVIAMDKIKKGLAGL